jgi:hypothetical protein
MIRENAGAGREWPPENSAWEGYLILEVIDG